MLPCAPSSSALRKEGRLTGHQSRVFDLRWSPAQPLRLASVGEKEGYIWSIDDAARRVRFPGTELMRVCWHPDGARVLTGDGQGKVAVRTADDGETAVTLNASEEDEVYGLEMLSMEGLLAVGAGNTVQLWDLPKAFRTVTVALPAADGGVTFGGEHRNPDAKAYVFGCAARGRLLSVALSDGTVRLLDSQTLQVYCTLTEHAQRGAAAFGTAISPTSTLLVTSDAEGTVLLWDIRRLGVGPLAETRSQGAVHSVAFVPGGTEASELLVTGGDRRVGLHETRSATLASVGAAAVLSPVLCVHAAPGAPAPRVASGGGSGGLMSDASISLWRVNVEDGPADGGAKKRQREEGQADSQEEQMEQKEQEKEADSQSEQQRPADATAAQSPPTPPTQCLPCRGYEGRV